MFYGLYNQTTVVPESLYPSPLSQNVVPKMAVFHKVEAENTGAPENKNQGMKSSEMWALN